jgi:hypothetical protein
LLSNIAKKYCPCKPALSGVYTSENTVHFVAVTQQALFEKDRKLHNEIALPVWMELKAMSKGA